MPESIQEDFASFQDGDPGVLLGVFTGEGNFSDNTIGISAFSPTVHRANIKD